MTVSLFKRDGSPYWWARVSRLDETGHVIGYDRVSTKRKEKAEAKRVAQALAKKAHDFDQLGERERATIGDAAQRYLNELIAMGKPSVKDYALFVKRLESSKSRLPISKLDRQFLSQIKSEGLARGFSPRYINNQITFWVSVHSKAKSDYGMDTRDFNTRNLKMKTQEKTRYLLDGEEERLLAELDPHRAVNGVGAPQRQLMQDQYDLVIFLLDTGARYSEVAQIPWSAVDYINWKSINLYRSKVGNEGKLAITNRLKEILQRRWDQNPAREKYVFPARGTSGHRGYATKGIRNAITRAGLNDPDLVKRYGKFTPHSLRHTFASRLVQGGMSLYAVSKLLGHSTTTMTQRYAHLSPSQVADEAASILNRRH